jgi:putative FmdB family regulatory protein
MPLYEYCCADCNASEERLCGYTSPTEYDCPSCGAPSGMRRRLSAPAIAFSGGGWYSEGYSHSQPPKADKPCEGTGSQDSPKSACCENCPAKN